jgi:nitroreductase
MDLEEAIKSRRTIRRFQDRDVPMELALKAIGLACWAPNPGNAQAWKFFVIKDRQTLRRMADALQAKVDLIASWPEAQEFGEAVGSYQRGAASLLRSAPMAIAATFGPYSSLADKILARRGPADPLAAEMISSRQSTDTRVETISGAVSLLLLALHSLGLGGCWMGGAMLAKREMEEILGIPEGHELFALVPVGYPAESPAAGARKPLDEVVQVI